MDQREIRSYTEKYLKQSQCQIIEAAPTHIITQLSIEADKDLLNRPFYWMYIENMNIEPQPARFCFIFDQDYVPEDIRGEYLFYGSTRFKQILTSAQKNGKFVRLYQKPTGFERFHSHSKPYHPWLGMNLKVSYICDQHKDRITYLGINLFTGEIREDFFSALQTMEWVSRLPEQRHTIRSRLSIPEAVGELEYFLQDQLQSEDCSWANRALERKDAELKQAEAYYPDVKNDVIVMEDDKLQELMREKKQRQREIVWQYHPRIEVKLINAGLFYLENGSLV